VRVRPVSQKWPSGQGLGAETLQYKVFDNLVFGAGEIPALLMQE
jgi:hypothetical protein